MVALEPPTPADAPSAGSPAYLLNRAMPPHCLCPFTVLHVLDSGALCSEFTQLLHAGAGQGIGRAFAHALGEAGASVAVVDINLKNAQTVTEELRSKGINSIAVHADVSKKADCAEYLTGSLCYQC